MGANSNKNKTARSGSGSKPTKKKKKPLKLTVSRTHKPEDLSLEEWQQDPAERIRDPTKLYP